MRSQTVVRPASKQDRSWVGQGWRANENHPVPTVNMLEAKTHLSKLVD